MTTQGKYYCVEGIGSDNKNEHISKPYRIIFLDSNFPFTSSIVKGARGYNTLKELRKHDETWINYSQIDRKSAMKICEKKFIFYSRHFVITPSDEEFNEVSYKLLKHTIFGELKKEITGIHLISDLNPHIKTVTQKSHEDKNGVWIADVEYYSKERDKLYLKQNSSMFPKSWCPTTFMFKIFTAYKVKQQCKSDSSIFHSITDCGIKVDFVIKNNIMKTVYPLYLGDN
ncbi:EndoU domain-containing protein [Flammeovirga aprica]|uniref:EndoU domain-containing protein n=1 Tax=Flammeovirga aprica JL-4 TaxID=694437 RepID=A0A7X9NZV3_9BACT|nr:EndoU domain-containing protein [Flammeovirga aprica]NME66598.1 EndoU domain-containing protein [Flammeovirga aprica JL-4]